LCDYRGHALKCERILSLNESAQHVHVIILQDDAKGEFLRQEVRVHVHLICELLQELPHLSLVHDRTLS